jgi:hypothetical protein
LRFGLGRAARLAETPPSWGKAVPAVSALRQTVPNGAAISEKEPIGWLLSRLRNVSEKKQSKTFGGNKRVRSWLY